jgi:anthranilate phosphoribosyltransferase
MDPKQALSRLTEGESLSRTETENLFGQLMDGELSDALKAALLIALRMKGEEPGEIAGAAAAMRRRVVAIPHRQPVVVDTCGTGGDGHGTFNISTAAAFLAAAGGAAVAKHGNRAVSSKSGSADVLMACGVDVGVSPETAGRALDEIGLAFLFAPKLHPAMREVMPIRHELGLRTIFNVLGPLTNPAGARRQVMGVYAPELVERMARVLVQLGSEHALVVHGSDGLDEITTTGPTRVAEVRGGTVEVYTVTPEDLGVRRVDLEALAGADPETNAALLRGVLTGETGKSGETGETGESREIGPLAEITAVNAGAALYVAGRAASLRQGVDQARQALAAGLALEKLEALTQYREAPGES